MGSRPIALGFPLSLASQHGQMPLTPGWPPHFTGGLGEKLQGPMRWGSANICPQRAHGGDQDQGVGLLPLLKIPNSLRRPRGPPLSALGVAGSRPPCGRPGLPVAGTWGEGSPRCHAAPVHLRPCGLRPQGQPLIGGTSGIKNRMRLRVAYWWDELRNCEGRGHGCASLDG